MEESMDQISRRRALTAGAVGSALVLTAGAATQAAAPPAARGKGFWSKEYATAKQRAGQSINLAIYRKRLEAPGPSAPKRQVLFLVHGSSNAALSSFDLTVPGHGEYSLMNVLARAGFDVWTMDHEGYGKSARTATNSDVASGAMDLKAAADLIQRETGEARISLLGESSGGLRAAVFAMNNPDRVARLGLAAFTYTGKGSSTLAERGKQLEFYKTHDRRPRDRAMIRSIFTRDRPGTTDPAVGDALADAELVYGDSVPTGTYLDMTANLPLVDPLKVKCPVLLVRGEYDGIATNEDLLDFFAKLPSGDKQFVILPGMAHSLAAATNRALFWHTVEDFMTMPKAVQV
jgi:alpha-beta hydrolase superfamily lysophospholipase